ncbi:helix-turn-helix domain-containing protein [Streptomyces sp. NPDC048436]|uniref:helix-turn-helix domain-containing protein n=1 Tax=Streptomyces sp. NPDC048436 TaxID=3365550 RepID=UPI0037131568
MDGMGESVGAGDLAELLRGLKERSGLSYGALAKRLHVSTSTLHRYVNGSAVPTEFAPLERFARVCGASREEMVGLHRQWILADASRGGERKEPPQPSQPSQSSQSSLRGVASPDVAPGADVGDAGDVSGAADDAPGIVIGPAPTAAGKRQGRRLPRSRVLVAAGVVLALGATAVAVQAASGGGDRDRHASVNSPSPEGGEREPSSDGAGSASPSGKEKGKESAKGKPGKETAEAEKSEGAGKGRGVGGADKASGGGGGGEGGVPVTVSTQAQYWQDPCGHPYLVDKGPGDLSPPPNEQDAPGWVSANGAVAARDQTVKLTVQGTGKDTVVLESLNVRVAQAAAPLAWTNYKMGYLGVGCGGNVPQHSFAVNLDASVPRPAPMDGGSGFPYTVSASDPEAFFVNATANTRYVRWYLELEWSSGARHGTVRIDDTGKPFATSGDKSRPVYGFSLDSKKWTKTNRDNDDVPDSAG